MKTEKLVTILAFLILCLGLGSCEEAQQEELIIEQTVDSLSFEISIEGIETSAFEIFIDTMSDVRYRIGFMYAEDDSVQIESLFVRTNLIEVGSFSLDNSVEDRIIDGILRIKGDSIGGTSFSFLNHEESSGFVEIDSIVSDRAFGSFDYEIFHPLDDRVIQLSCQFKSVPL